MAEFNVISEIVGNSVSELNFRDPNIWDRDSQFKKRCSKVIMRCIYRCFISVVLT